MEQGRQTNAEVPARTQRRIPKKALGLRTTALIESLLFLLVVAALSYLFSDGSRFIDFSPHPYWIIVLLVAAQYGTGEALVTSILASVVLLAWNLPEQTLDESTFDYIFHTCSKPLMWVIASVVIGEIRIRHKQREQELREDLKATLERETTITRAYEQLRSVKEGLETRIAGHLQGTVALYQSLKSIEGLSPVQILMGVGEMVGNVINPEKFSVFSFGPNGFEVISSVGWVEEDGYSRRLSSKSPLVQELMNSRRIVCAINRQDAEIIKDEGILAGPLIDQQSGQVFGMLKIEVLDFIDLNATNVETFKILCEWAGSAYAQARQFQETLADTMHNPDTGVMSKQFKEFSRQLLVELNREQQIQSSMIDISLTPSRRQTPQERIATARHFHQSLGKQLPASAIVCDGRRQYSSFVVLLPGIGTSGADAIASKLKKWKNGNWDDTLSSIEIQFIPSPIE